MKYVITRLHRDAFVANKNNKENREDHGTYQYTPYIILLTHKVLVTTIDAQWEGMGDVGLARYELALLPLCPTLRVLSYSN